MLNKKLIIYGIGRFAEYAGFLFKNDSSYTVSGFCIESSLLGKENIFNKDVDFVPFEELEDLYSPEKYHLFIAVGNNVIRQRIFETAKQKGYSCANYISSKAVFWDDLIIGENSFVGEGAVLQPFIKIGNNSLLFGARMGHHCEVRNHVLLSGCLLGGNVRVGDCSFIGLNATVKENTEIEENNIIGMGAVINSNTKANEIYTAPHAKRRNTKFQEINRKFFR